MSTRSISARLVPVGWNGGPAPADAGGMSDSASGISGLAARADVSSAVSMAVAAKALDQARSQGAAVVEMIRAAGEVQKSASAAAARAGGVDTYA